MHTSDLVVYKWGGTGGLEGYGRREREGREEGDLRGREAGEKCETLIILIQQCITKLLKSRNQNIFDLHLTSSQSLLSKRANEQTKICVWAEKQAYFR